MTMKKILMAAVAVSAISAGAANAASITEAKISNVGVYSIGATTPSAPYLLANEVKFGTTGLDTTTANNNLVALVDTGLLADGNYTVTVTYSGPVKFATGLGNADMTAFNAYTAPATLGAAATTISAGACTSIQLSTGGLATTGALPTVTYLVSVSGCTGAGATTLAPRAFSLSPKLTITGLGAVTAKVNFQKSGIDIDNGQSAAVTLVQNTAAFAVSAVADTTPTYWDLSGTNAYTVLTADVGSDAVIGKYSVAPVATTVYLSADAASNNTTAGQVIRSNLTVTGDVSVLDVYAATAGNKLTATSTAKTAASISAQGAQTNPTTFANIGVLDLATAPTAAQTEKAYTLTVTPLAPTTGALYTAPAAITVPMQTVGLEGTSFVAPWVSGPEQTNFTTSIRISNQGSSDTGAVTLLLKSPTTISTTSGVTATSCNSAKLPSLAKIAANGELNITTANLETCFGNFKRADVIVTIQAAKTNLTAKMRSVTSVGLNNEISLGGLNQTGLSY